LTVADSRITNSVLGENINSKIRVSPNPISEYLTINVENPLEKREVILVDMLGNEVINYKTNLQENKIIIPISQLSDGMYILRVKSDTNSMTERVFILK